MMNPSIDSIRKSLGKELPGKKAHIEFARSFDRFIYDVPKNVKTAAVLLLLFPGEKQEWNTVFIQRRINTNRLDRHSGQMSFPGGKYEDSDRSLAFTALREAEEEIGLSSHKVELIGELSELFIPVSNFLVKPFVGFTREKPVFQAQLEEVHEIVTESIDNLMNPKTIKKTDITVKEGVKLKNVRYFDVKGKIVWGATSMMLNEFLTTLKSNP